MAGRRGESRTVSIGVFLGYASCWGQGLLDRGLFVPQDWSQDRERCRRAGIPDAVVYQPKTELARQMLEQALDCGVTAQCGSWQSGAPRDDWTPQAVNPASFAGWQRARWSVEAWTLMRK